MTNSQKSNITKIEIANKIWHIYTQTHVRSVNEIGRWVNVFLFAYIKMVPCKKNIEYSVMRDFSGIFDRGVQPKTVAYFHNLLTYYRSR